MAEQRLGVDTGELFFTDRECDNRNVGRLDALVAGDAWSKELEGSRDLIGDWVGKKCGNYNTKTNKCGGQGS